MKYLAIIIALAMTGCVPLAAGVIGYEVAKDNCWRQRPTIVYPDGTVYAPSPVRVC